MTLPSDLNPTGPTTTIAGTAVDPVDLLSKAGANAVTSIQRLGLVGLTLAVIGFGFWVAKPGNIRRPTIIITGIAAMIFVSTFVFAPEWWTAIIHGGSTTVTK